jgi:spore maturation protein CgeD
MLQEAIDSVLRQTYRDFELLILDDNSDLPFQRTILERYRNHPKCVVHVSDVSEAERRSEVRYAVLANVALEMARGDYITYLCDDDYYLPQRLERMVERLDTGDCTAVYGSQRLMRAGREVGIREATAVLDDPLCKVDHSSVMHTLDAGREVGGWDTSPQFWRMADGIFWRKLCAAGHYFHPINEVLDVHRFNRESVSERMDAGTF